MYFRPQTSVERYGTHEGLGLGLGGARLRSSIFPQIFWDAVAQTAKSDA